MLQIFADASENWSNSSFLKLSQLLIMCSAITSISSWLLTSVLIRSLLALDKQLCHLLATQITGSRRNPLNHKNPYRQSSSISPIWSVKYIWEIVHHIIIIYVCRSRRKSLNSANTSWSLTYLVATAGEDELNDYSQ